MDPKKCWATVHSMNLLQSRVHVSRSFGKGCLFEGAGKPLPAAAKRGSEGDDTCGDDE